MAACFFTRIVYYDVQIPAGSYIRALWIYYFILLFEENDQVNVLELLRILTCFCKNNNVF